MIIVLIFVLFFSSVAFGQVPCTQQSINQGLGSISGTLLFSDGKTPIPYPYEGYGTRLDLYDTDGYLWSTSPDSYGHYSFSNVNTTHNPLHFYVQIFNNGSSVGTVEVPAFNITADQSTVVNVTTSRMLTD